MALDWIGLGRLIAPAAPKIGGLLGGIVGGPAGAIVGPLAGSVLAGLFPGADPRSPDSLADAIRADPQAGAKLAEADERHSEALIAAAQAASEQTSEINTTIRAELGAGVSWWHWRHLLGYVVGSWALALIAPVLKMLWTIDTGAIGAAINLVTALMPAFLALCALLGYVAQDTTKRMTTAAVGEHPDGGILTTVGRVLTGIRR